MAIFVLRKGKKILVEKKARIADSSFKRFKGLMLEKPENFNYALIFEMPFESRSASSIHMLFMNFPIDALFLDSEKKIVDIAENLRPWVLNFTPKKPAKFIIEMNAGLAGKFKLKNRERMVF